MLIKLLLVASAFSILILLPLYCEGGEFSYECPSGQAIYQGVAQTYKDAQQGVDTTDFFQEEVEWASHGCLVEQSYRSSTANILGKMINDPKIQELVRGKAAAVYAQAIGPDDFLLNQARKASDGLRREIVWAILDTANMHFDYIEYFKKQLIGEPDQAVRNQYLIRFSTRFVPTFEALRTFCETNHISLSLQVVAQYQQLSALNYLIEHPAFFDEMKMNYRDRYNQIVTPSKYVLAVLGKHLDIVFPQAPLQMMSLKDLRILRNSIYATYGKNFKSKILEYYFFGDYPYVKEYCRNTVCGLGQRKRGQFKESDLTPADKTNIDQISRIENNRHIAGVIEADLFVENYDYKAFMNGTADNLILAPTEGKGLEEFKLDWDRKQVWIWDKQGVSGYDLTSERRIKFIKKAQGPLYLSRSKRLLAYHIGEKIVLENISSGKIIHEESIHNDYIKNMPYYLPEDGRYFIYFNVKQSDPMLGICRVTVIDLETGQRRDIDLGSMVTFGYLEPREYTARPFAITIDNWLIAIIDVAPSIPNPSFLLVPLDERPGNSVKKLTYKVNYVRYSSHYTMQLTEDSQKLVFYFSNEGPLEVFNVSDVINASTSMPDPGIILRPFQKENAANHLNDLVGDAMLLTSYTYSSVDHENKLAVLPIGSTDQINWRSISPSFNLASTVLLENENMFAQGDGRGFVVFRRFKSK